MGANAQVFVPGYKMPASIPDGLSNTIFFAEHYSVCGPSTFVWTLGQSWCSHEGQHVPCVGRAERHPTFAEASFSDVVPVTIGAGGAARTVGSLPLTFQVRPSLAECDPRVPNSSISGGLLVALADGSVRLVRRGIDPQAFWSAVTPAGGESVALD